MKKKLAVLLSLTLAASMLTVGCGNKTDAPAETPAQTEAPATTDAPADAPVAEEGSLKTGFAALVGASSHSKDAEADADGTAEVDSTVAAVTVDADGKIVECVLDSVQVKVNFDATGKITSDLASTFDTKNELKEGYNMKGVSGIGKEWYEQAQAFADYCVGKTAEEVRGIALDEKTAPTDADLAAGCTVSAGEFVESIAQAAETATDMGAQAGDKLGLAIVDSISKSTDATADAEGLAQAYVHYAVTTTDADGKITSCILNASQGNMNFDATGKITTDLATTYKTKNELKDDYGMRGASAIGKEWFEQAEAFAQYCVGKTSDEVAGIAMDQGVPTDADLAAGCTVHATDFVNVVSKAAANAK